MWLFQLKVYAKNPIKILDILVLHYIYVMQFCVTKPFAFNGKYRSNHSKQ